jgi:hypothetical protein
MTTDQVAAQMMGRHPKYASIPTNAQVREAEQVQQEENRKQNPSAFEMPKTKDQKIAESIELIKKKFVGKKIGDYEVTGVAEILKGKKDVWVYLELKKSDKTEPIGEVAMKDSDVDKTTDGFENDPEIAALKPVIKISVRQEYYAWPAKSTMGKKIAKLLKKDTPEAEKTPKAAGASEPVNGSDQRSKKNEQKKKDGKKVKAAF